MGLEGRGGGGGGGGNLKNQNLLSKFEPLIKKS